MQVHTKKKVEIVIAQPIMRQILDLLDNLGCTGYTVVRAISGKGHHSSWDLSDLSDSTRHVVIVVIVSEEAAARILEEIKQVFRHHHGIVFTSSVEVIRSDYF